jgi:glycosyltransferase involved in cell wall biosynthesis
MKINLTCPINISTGYGHHCRNTLIHLVQNGIDVTLFPIGRCSTENKIEDNIVSNAFHAQATFDSDAISLRIYQQFDLAHHVGSGKRIGFTVFELDSFRQQEVRHLESNDHIITCSEWGKDVIFNKTSIPQERISVVPLGVDTTIFNPHIPPFSSLLRDNKETFVILNCGKMEKRKGHDIISKIFSKAFNQSDNVELWIMGHNPFLRPDEEQKWHQDIFDCKLSRKVRLIPHVQSHIDVSHIMNQANCGFFPSRAEGWNLELLEMMACGKPCICLNYSGHSQYINSDNSLCIKPRSLEVANDGKWFLDTGSWASITPDVEDFFVEGLRSLYKSHKDGIIVPQAKSALETAQTYTWENSVKDLIKVLEENE